jgi:AcrR family transcriptional regulator
LTPGNQVITLSKQPMTEPPTRERLLTAARRLFAEQGYAGTSVGDVEAAAGLTPRSGALYKHFPSKEALLRAVFESYPGMEALDEHVTLLDLGDLRAEIVLIGRVGLDELRRERDLIRVVMKEGERFPEVAEIFKGRVVQRSHRLAARWIRERLPRHGGHAEDPEALGSVIVDALVGYVVEELLFGPAAGGGDDERFLAAWVQTTHALMSSTIDVRSDAA